MTGHVSQANGVAARAPEMAPGTRQGDPPLLVLWRRAWLVLLALLICTGAAAVLARELPKIYETTATMWVDQGRGTTSFDSVQASEVLARTYANVARSERVAGVAARRLPFEASPESLLDQVEIAPVEETQLVEITASDRRAERAKAIADTYATALRDYASARRPDAGRATITVASPAGLPDGPARPQPLLYTGLGALLGLLLGAGLALLAERLDLRVGSPEELADLLEVPILARIPRMSGSDESRASYDDAFALLRTNLQFMRPDRRLRSVAVVSPSQGEGKTTIALNLARAFAGIGQRVLLVEGDMRRPGLRASLLDADVGARAGLSNYLAGAVYLEDVIYETSMPNLRLLPAGPLPPAPSELLDAPRGRDLVNRIAEHADIVVLDTPPLSVGSDASLFAAAATGTLMVADLTRSTKGSFRRAREQLAVAHAAFLGVVVNRSRRNREDQLSGYYRYYRSQPTANGRGRSRPRVDGDETARRATRSSH